jgi:hypothetical protein
MCFLVCLCRTQMRLRTGYGDPRGLTAKTQSCMQMDSVEGFIRSSDHVSCSVESHKHEVILVGVGGSGFETCSCFQSANSLNIYRSGKCCGKKKSCEGKWDTFYFQFAFSSVALNGFRDKRKGAIAHDLSHSILMYYVVETLNTYE